MFWLMKEQRAATTGNPFREVARTVYGCGVRLEEGEKGQRAGASGTGWGVGPYPEVRVTVDFLNISFIVIFTIRDVCAHFLNFIYFNWRITTLQYCGGFCHTSTWINHGCSRPPHPEHLPPPPPPSPPHPSGLSQSTGSECPLHVSNLHWSSILHMVIYMLLFSYIVPPSASPTSSKSLFFTSVSLLLPCI